MTDEYLTHAWNLFIDFSTAKKKEEYIKLTEARQKLPIYNQRDEILKLISENRVILIAADTGAGKSTQVPQYLLEAGYTKICVTQPRRIACFSLAKRVSYETMSRYKIGYQVRFDKSLPQTAVSVHHQTVPAVSSKEAPAAVSQEGRLHATQTTAIQDGILFVTEGILLKQLSNDCYLKKYNIIIIDEVHERNLIGDFLLGILKKLIQSRLDIKIILMSATINSELFRNYFNAPIIEIPGKMFPVQIEYHPYEPIDTNLTDPKFIKQRQALVIPRSLASKPNRLKPEPYLEILKDIDASVPETERGDLLIFMSGMYEIQTLTNFLSSYASITRRWIILQLHSALSMAHQERVFDVAPPGIRKCIVTTNIAETSVTIDGIRFIVDSGKVKELGHHTVTGISRLEECWVSRSSAKQRTGRAGRTGPGKCYRLYSAEEYSAFNEFNVPEIQRVPLESVVLEIMALGLGDPRKFEFVEMPGEEAIEAAMVILVGLGCVEVISLDQQEQDKNLKNSDLESSKDFSDFESFERVTPLGRVLSALPIDLVLGKMLVLGSISELITPIIAVAAGLSVQSPFTRTEMTGILTNRKTLLSPHGDPFTILNLFSCWLKIKLSGGVGEARTWCKRFGVEEQRMYEMVKLKDQFSGILRDYSFARDDGDVNQEKEGKEGNLNGGDEEAEQAARLEKYAKRQLKEKIAKRKMETRGASRKMLKLTDGLEFGDDQDGAAEKEQMEEGDLIETVDELEFQIRQDSDSLLIQTDVSVLSEQELAVIKLIICSGLYPHIAISDDANPTRPATEQVFHTKNKSFLNMIPKSVFDIIPDVLHSVIDSSKGAGKQDSLASIHAKRIQKELLCYVQILETTKPYLNNVVRIRALETALLFAERVDVTPCMRHLIVDEWLDLEFDSKIELETLLVEGCWLRYAWKRQINRKLEKFDRGIGNDGVGYVSARSSGKALDSLSYLSVGFKQMRKTWTDLSIPENSNASDQEIVERLVDLVDCESSYSCSRLGISTIDTLFGYSPYALGEDEKNYKIELTPHFNYYLERPMRKDSHRFSLKSQIQANGTKAPDNPIKSTNGVDSAISGNQRSFVECDFCGKRFFMTDAEFSRHSC